MIYCETDDMNNALSMSNCNTAGSSEDREIVLLYLRAMSTPKPGSAAHAPASLAKAREVLETEARAITELMATLDERFERAVQIILTSRGRVVVSGMGKSGHIGRKMASTLASTGTPAFFVHPGEASHGDLGMVTKEDVFIALSNSGESVELLSIVPVIKRQGAKLIAFTGNLDSTLARESDVAVYAGARMEACPLNLAPTASTTAALALGDALAVALMEARGFTREQFARSHPGGALGRRLLTHVRDVMRSGDDAPAVHIGATLMEAVREVTRGKLGMTAIIDDERRVAGIFTDGDIRRTLEKGRDFGQTRIADVMTPDPQVISPDKLAAEAVELMERYRINQMLVVDDEGRLVGALNMHDLFRAKVI
jgi:arabinose-5-phosphate isomerase